MLLEHRGTLLQRTGNVVTTYVVCCYYIRETLSQNTGHVKEKELDL